MTLACKCGQSITEINAQYDWSNYIIVGGASLKICDSYLHIAEVRCMILPTIATVLSFLVFADKVVGLHKQFNLYCDHSDCGSEQPWKQ